MTNDLKLIMIMATIVIFLALGLLIGVAAISYSNKENSLRILIETKVLDNYVELDNVVKKIAQGGQVVTKDRESLTQLFDAYRNGNGGDDKAISKWIQEAVPNVSSDLFKNYMNMIISSRDAWTMRQKELLGYYNVHEEMIRNWPGSWLFKNRPRINIKIVTSTRTQKAMETGIDDDVKVF